MVNHTQALPTFECLVRGGGTSGPAQLGATVLRPKSLRGGWCGVYNAYSQPEVWRRGVANLVRLMASAGVEP